MKTNQTRAAMMMLSLVFSLMSCEDITWKTPKDQPESRISDQPVLINNDIAKVRKQIDEINQILEIAILNGDYETQLGYFTDDVIIDPPIQPTVKGKEAIQAGYEMNKKDSVVYNAFDAITEDLWVCGDKVYERGSWGMAISSKSTPIPKAYSGSYFEIWEQGSDSVFQISYMIYSLDFYPH